MLLLAASFWLLTRSYNGLFHDARLYALQGLARLNPEALSQDVFLRFGSQDSFTLFSPVYAAAIGWLGLEDAARLLTLAGHLWWFTAMWFLARALMDARRAALAVALVAGLPGYYGAWEVFRYAEPFLTPRLYSEAAILSALACGLRSRLVTGGAFALLALLLHPLMAAGGIVLFAWLSLGPRRGWYVPLMVVLGTVVASAIALVAPMYPLSRFDPEWMQMVRQRSPFLFIQDWGLESWEGVLTALLGLMILGSRAAYDPARKLFVTAVGVGILGISVTAIGASTFEVVLLTQGQGWRWTWIASALLGVAAVAGLPSAWADSPGARAAVCLLAAGWVLVGWPAIALLLAAGTVWLLRNSLRGRLGRGLELVAFSVAAMAALAWYLNLPPLQALAGVALAPPPRPAIAALYTLFSSGAVPILIAWGVWRLAIHFPRSAVPAIVVLAFTAFCALGVLPEWQRVDYQVRNPPVADEWTRRIPASAEVFAPEDPGLAWYILRRRSYLSTDQSAGVVFSREAAMAMRERAHHVRPVLPPSFALGAASSRSWRLSGKSLSAACTKSGVDFVVHRQRLPGAVEIQPLSVLDRRTGLAEQHYLYDCADVRNLSTPSLTESRIPR